KAGGCQPQTGCSICKSSPREGIGMRLTLPTTKLDGIWSHRGRAYPKSTQMKIATKLPCPRGGDTTTHDKEPALSSWTGPQRSMGPTGLGARSAAVWCHAPVTPLDPETCRHH